MASEHYSAFVEEAFVKPIRSVLIVDDDYPTFEEMLDAQLERSAGREPPADKEWFKDPTRIKNVIASFRTPTRPLLVDIHDGANVTVGEDLKVAHHLHQSDLLVLDYQLDKSRPGDGSVAVQIIRTLLRNEHFNLVVVHTSEDLDRVFTPTLIALMRPQEVKLSVEDRARAALLLEDLEDETEGASAKMAGSIGLAQYLHSRRYPAQFTQTMRLGSQPYSDFRALCPDAWDGDDRRLVLKHLLERVETSLEPQFNPEAAGELVWDDGPVKYIKADSVFVAFSSKGDDDDLLKDLLEALNAWRPQPSRMFHAKLRAEMDEFGVLAQGGALENRHALAHWYKRLLETDGTARRWLIAESVSRHAEQLLGDILHRVEDFAGRLVAVEAKAGTPNDVSKSHFKIDLANDAENTKARQEHNVAVCSKLRTGWHLTTGHVFRMNEAYWVCVSPACDMVPGQLSAQRIQTFGERLPFIALKLNELKDTKAPKDIQTNRYAYVRVDGTIKGFCVNDPGGETSTPEWHILFAEKRGEFSKGFHFKIFYPQAGKRGMVQKRVDAEVVAQLRYEYALNLVQRLNGAFTRIGLDFV